MQIVENSTTLVVALVVSTESAPLDGTSCCLWQLFLPCLLVVASFAPASFVLNLKLLRVAPFLLRWSCLHGCVANAQTTDFHPLPLHHLLLDDATLQLVARPLMTIPSYLPNCSLKANTRARACACLRNLTTDCHVD